LGASSGEDASIATTDADVSALIWQGWDDDGLYYIAEVRDIEASQDLFWFTPDGLMLFVDLLDSNDQNDNFPNAGEFTSVSFTAAPQHSSVEGKLDRTQDHELIAPDPAGSRDRNGFLLVPPRPG
jgi:hypothetical protein